MPRIKRWFPVNHNINRDPEVWVMRREIGEKSLSIWLEFLSIADQNEGHIPGDYDPLIRSVSGTCQATVRTVSAVYQYAISKVWLKSDPSLHIVKYWNYHKLREPQKPLLGSLPSDPSDPILTNPPIVPRKKTAAQPEGFAEFWNFYPKKKAKGTAEKAWNKINPDADLRKLIMAGVGRGRSSHEWLKQSGQFIPHPATWLRAKGWEDQGISYSVRPIRNHNAHAPKPVEEKLTPEQIEENKSRLQEMINGLSGKMAVER